MNKTETLNKAMKIIEEWRYTYDLREAVTQFVLHWAFLHTGLYPPTHSMVKKHDYNLPAEKLAKLLSASMLNGYADPIGDILTELGVNKQIGYFNSPDGVGELLSQLMGRSSCSLSYYEVCSGTGAITMQEITDIVESNTDTVNPLEGMKFVLEELSSVNCAASLIQIFHRLEYLSKYKDHYVYPAEISISNIDVISREKGKQSYFLTGFSPKGQP
ncbi:hypothetical protein ACRZ5S_22785 (plasmid) [Vibrio scophthalmi]|uniref:hypothetical protein n=1 Tax=Vibrio scophthalmi TaxID=45658 RepID=UPI003EB92B16